MPKLIEELRRRNVFRVAVAYLVASWLVLQVADIVLQGIEAPPWVMQVFMLVLALVFPFVLLFSWAYELTPEGLKKEKDVDRSHSITPATGHKLNLITIGMLVAVVAAALPLAVASLAPGFTAAAAAAAGDAHHHPRPGKIGDGAGRDNRRRAREGFPSRSRHTPCQNGPVARADYAAVIAYRSRCPLKGPAGILGMITKQ